MPHREPGIASWLEASHIHVGARKAGPFALSTVQIQVGSAQCPAEVSSGHRGAVGSGGQGTWGTCLVLCIPELCTTLIGNCTSHPAPPFLHLAGAARTVSLLGQVLPSPWNNVLSHNLDCSPRPHAVQPPPPPRSPMAWTLRTGQEGQPAEHSCE